MLEPLPTNCVIGSTHALFSDNLFLTLEYPEFLWCDVSMQHTAVCQNSQSVTPKSARDRVSFQRVSRSWYCCSLILEDICIFYLNLICVKKPKLAALCQLGVRISKLSECRIDSTANHSCPMMDQSVCAVTSIYRACTSAPDRSETKTVPNKPLFPVFAQCRPLSRSYYWSCMLSKDISDRGHFLQYYDTVKSGAAPELWKAGIWRNGLYLCLGKPEPSPEMTPSFLFAAEAN